jgi:hypothetical protein
LSLHHESDLSSAIFTTTDGGTTWHDRTPRDHALPWSSVDCTIGGRCWTTDGGGILRTTDAGLHWDSERVPRVYGLAAVSCVSTSVCLAAGGGDLVRTADGGASWVGVALPSGVLLHSLTCQGSSCIAVGQSGDAGVILKIGAQPRDAIRRGLGM